MNKKLKYYFYFLIEKKYKLYQCKYYLEIKKL